MLVSRSKNMSYWYENFITGDVSRTKYIVYSFHIYSWKNAFSNSRKCKPGKNTVAANIVQERNRKYFCANTSDVMYFGHET